MSSNPCTVHSRTLSLPRTTPPRGLAGAGSVIPPEYFSSIPLSISFQCEGRSEWCSSAHAGIQSFLTHGFLPPQGRQELRVPVFIDLGALWRYTQYICLCAG